MPRSVTMPDFNSRPSARGDVLWGTKNRTGRFQFTPLREGRQHCCERMSTIVLFQFTPLREGRLGAMLKSMGIADISIHAPPRGATKPQLRTRRKPSKFQFTPLREGRLATSESPGVGKISIHAPPRGATPTQLPRDADARNFNSRPSARGDTMSRMPSGLSLHFNSRPSARGDRNRGERAPSPCNFNSRPSARGDADDAAVSAVQGISIHAPPRGATNAHAAQTTAASNFNSRPSARGDRSGVHQNRNDTVISIHAPPRGATWSFPPSRDYPTFQFTPLREGRHIWIAAISVG